MACEEIIDYLENGNITNSVNSPAAQLPRSGDPRVCIFHDNAPDNIAKITGAVSALGANVANMLTAGMKGKELSYTILDVSKVPDGLEAAIKKDVSGVTRIRIIK